MDRDEAEKGSLVEIDADREAAPTSSLTSTDGDDRLTLKLDRLIEALQQADCRPREEGRSSRWRARCPLCPEKPRWRDSLQVTLDEERGRIVLWDHAGCQTNDILEVLGLRWGDLAQQGG